jgi:hypothetical protein
LIKVFASFFKKKCLFSLFFYKEKHQKTFIDSGRVSTTYSATVSKAAASACAATGRGLRTGAWPNFQP